MSPCTGDTFRPARSPEPTVHCPSQPTSCSPPTHPKLSLCPDAHLPALPPLLRRLTVGRTLPLPVQSGPQRLQLPGGITQPCRACGPSQHPGSSTAPSEPPAPPAEGSLPDSQYAPSCSAHVSQVEFSTGCLCLKDPTV